MVKLNAVVEVLLKQQRCFGTVKSILDQCFHYYHLVLHLLKTTVLQKKEWDLQKLLLLLVRLASCFDGNEKHLKMSWGHDDCYTIGIKVVAIVVTVTTVAKHQMNTVAFANCCDADDELNADDKHLLYQQLYYCLFKA